MLGRGGGFEELEDGRAQELAVFAFDAVDAEGGFGADFFEGILGNELDLAAVGFGGHEGEDEWEGGETGSEGAKQGDDVDFPLGGEAQENDGKDDHRDDEGLKPEPDVVAVIPELRDFEIEAGKEGGGGDGGEGEDGDDDQALRCDPAESEGLSAEGQAAHGEIGGQREGGEDETDALLEETDGKGRLVSGVAWIEKGNGEMEEEIEQRDAEAKGGDDEVVARSEKPGEACRKLFQIEAGGEADRSDEAKDDEAEEGRNAQSEAFIHRVFREASGTDFGRCGRWGGADRIACDWV